MAFLFPLSCFLWLNSFLTSLATPCHCWWLTHMSIRSLWKNLHFSGTRSTSLTNSPTGSKSHRKICLIFTHTKKHYSPWVGQRLVNSTARVRNNESPSGIKKRITDEMKRVWVNNSAVEAFKFHYSVITERAFGTLTSVCAPEAKRDSSLFYSRICKFAIKIAVEKNRFHTVTHLKVVQPLPVSHWYHLLDGFNSVMFYS